MYDPFLICAMSDSSAKQDEEIGRVISDIRDLQKSLNQSVHSIMFSYLCYLEP